MMSSKIFWDYINSHINEVSMMMNDWMVGLLNSNDKINFIYEQPNSNVIYMCSAELNEKYDGGVCVTFGIEYTKAFKSFPIEEMRRILQVLEKNIGVKE